MDRSRWGSCLPLWHPADCQLFTCLPTAGKPKSIRETFDEVFQSIPYCIQLAGGPYIETKPECVKAFRPPADRRQPKAAS